MKKSFKLAGVDCPECDAAIRLEVESALPRLKAAKAACESCDWQLDLLEASRAQSAKFTDKAKSIAKGVAGGITEAGRSLPKDREQLKQAIRDPRHPFTAAVLTGLVLLAMEASGFGVFLALTWILGTLVLTPVGWLLIPAVVAIAFAYRSRFRAENRKQLQEELEVVEKQRESGELTEEEFKAARADLIAQFFS